MGVARGRSLFGGGGLVRGGGAELCYYVLLGGRILDVGEWQ